MKNKGVPAAFAGCLLLATPAFSATLSGPVTGWASGVPSYISMYEYVPAKVAPNPPILVVSHYCSGNASGMFGEAQGGGIVAAADEYGFVMIFPQTSNNCWDVGSQKSLTHDGGGDTQAIAQMVKYAITEHGANSDRVYAIGTSSGAMMTEALLAVYPDVFKAGAEFSGVAAGCWSASYSASNQWSGPCATGQVSHTAEQWGELVHAMYTGYDGPRPRIQLWHGTADSTIYFENQGEAIKEWTDVLGLSTAPTSTAMQTVNNHQWAKQSWQDGCGYTVLEAWAEQNGPHGTDANLDATYVIPFLGLDKSGPTDPEVAQCGSGGSAGSGGNSGNPGMADAGASGGTSGVGGTADGAGGTRGSNDASIGSAGASVGSGGTDVGGVGASGGGGKASSGTGGDLPSNGATAGAAGSNGFSGSSGGFADGGPSQPSSDSSGCSCRMADASRSRGPLEVGGAVALAAMWGRRRRCAARRRA